MVRGEDLEKADTLPGTGPPDATQFLLVRDTLTGKDYKLPGDRLPVAPSGPLFAAISVMTARELQADDAVKLPPFTYLLLNAGAGADAGNPQPTGSLVLSGLPADVARDLGSRFQPEGFWLDPDTDTWKRVAYDLATDTVSPIAAGAGLPAPVPFANQTSVTVTHNLGRAVVVEVYNTAGQPIRGALTVLNPNSLQLIFSQPLSGTVVLR